MRLFPCAYAILLVCLPLAVGAQPAPDSQKSKQQWFREARLGVMIHWGLYSVAAGEWKGKPLAGSGELLQREARLSAKEYERLAAQFKGEAFRPAEWVKMAAGAGAKYLVFTAKQSDGFAMYGSAVSKFNVVDATPFHRDPLKELAAECAKQNIKLGIYYSLDQDWHERNGHGNNWEFGAEGGINFERYLQEKAEPQIKELLSNYGPIAVVRFGLPKSPLMRADQAKHFAELVRSLQPGALVAGGFGGDGDFASYAGDQVPIAPKGGAFEVVETLNQSWGFNKFDNEWKPVDGLIFKLVDIASKSGTYLLNTSPSAEGYIAPPMTSTVAGIGMWFKQNAEAFDGTVSSRVTAEFRVASDKPGMAGGKPVLASSDKWRTLAKPGKVMVAIFEWPDTPLTLRGLDGQVKKAYFLEAGEQQPLPFTQSGDRAVLNLPKDPTMGKPASERIDPRYLKIANRIHMHQILVLEMSKR